MMKMLSESISEEEEEEDEEREQCSQEARRFAAYCTQWDLVRKERRCSLWVFKHLSRLCLTISQTQTAQLLARILAYSRRHFLYSQHCNWSSHLKT